MRRQTQNGKKEAVLESGSHIFTLSVLFFGKVVLGELRETSRFTVTLLYGTWAEVDQADRYVMTFDGNPTC